MKFKSKQTAALQQAMYWWEKDVLIPLAPSSVAAAEQHVRWSASNSSGSNVGSSSGSSSDSSSGGDIQPAQHSSSSNVDEDASVDVASSISSSLTNKSNNTSNSSSGSNNGSDLARCDLAEQALRLSFAALQAVPESSPKVCVHDVCLQQCTQLHCHTGHKAWLNK
jgi:hypothetical protein